MKRKFLVKHYRDHNKLHLNNQWLVDFYESHDPPFSNEELEYFYKKDSKIRNV